jgi:uncharacterized repeat protein (TIGR03803 family)
VAVAILILAISATPAAAQAFSTLHNFCTVTNCTDGYYSSSGLIQGTDGNYYGTAYYGGDFGAGSVYNITADGDLTTFYSFCGQANCADGYHPWPALVLGSDGRFYGTTTDGGANGNGTIFSLTGDGTLTTLYNFCSQANCADGYYSGGALLQGTDGNYYGLNSFGGLNGAGTIFRITPSGTYTTLHTFCSQTNCPDGIYPRGALVQGANGNFYGVTSGDGGYTSYGTVFSITPSDTFTILHTFCSQGGVCKDGFDPWGGLAQGNDGNLYGTTEDGGTEYCERRLNHSGPGCGTVFKITPGGRLTTILALPGPKAGENPTAQLILASDGKFYGATMYGGTHTNVGCAPAGCGTLFSITSDGALRTVHNFRGYLDDGYISAQLLQGTDGNFYGSTIYGGTIGYCEFGCGTVFSLSQGLSPFVKPIPPSTRVGTSVIILGNNLTGSSSVTFNGTAAIFTVVSNTEITATVPSGASTGEIQVVTPTGTLTSNVSFGVTN